MIRGGFADDVAAGRSASVQVLLSGTNSNTATAACGYATAIVAGFARETLMEHAARTVESPGVRAQTRIWCNPQLELKQFNAISMIVVACIIVGVITAAAGLVRERESGTIE